MGVRLCLRKHRGVALTVEGEVWRPQVSTHLRAIHQTADDLFGHGPQRVTIAASASVIQGWLVPRLARIQADDRLRFSFSKVVLAEDFDKGGGVHVRYSSGPWPGYRTTPYRPRQLWVLRSILREANICSRRAPALV